MRKRKSIRFRGSDFVVGAVCLFLLSGSLYLFERDLNRTLADLNRAPIAFVSFKENTVMRRLQSRTLWDRLQKDSPVYDGDIIRLADDSQATVTFTADGSSMDMASNSMAQIFATEEGIAVNLGSDGGVSVKATDESQGFSIADESGARVSVTGKSQFTVERSSGVMGVQVLEGTASLVSPSGAEHELSDGGALQVTPSGSVETPPLAVLEPAQGHKVLIMDGVSAAVPISWTTDAAHADKPAVLTTSSSASGEPELSRQEITSGTDAVIYAGAGTTYWTLTVFDDAAETGSVSVRGQITGIAAASPQLTVPFAGQQFSYRNEHPRVRFQWEGGAAASSYLVEAADNPEMENPMFSQAAGGTVVSTESLGAGDWYWRVTAFYTAESGAVPVVSAVSSFSITQKQALAVPAALVPADNAMILCTLDENGERSGEATFSWKGDAETAVYTVSFASDPSVSSIIQSFNTTSNYVTVNFGGFDIPDGLYYWSVSGASADGSVSESSTPRSFTVVTERPAPAVPAEPTVIDAYEETAAESAAASVPVFVSLPKNGWSFDGLEALRSGVEVQWRCASRLESSRFVLSRRQESGEYVAVLSHEDPAERITITRLGAGEYQWRIEGLTAAGQDVVMEPMSFTVREIPPLAPAVLAEPAPEFVVNAAYLRSSRTLEFRWEPPAGATSQTFSIYRRMSDGRPGWKVLEEELPGAARAYTLSDLSQLDVGSFIWSVDAQAEGADGIVEQFGTPASSVFSIQIPLPRQVEMIAPVIAEEE